MSTTTGDWYVSRGGERFGPVSFQDLIDAARSGRLEPRTDLVYGASLAAWTPAGEVDGVFEKVARKESAEGDVHAPPAETLADSGSYDFGGRPTHLKLPGAKRLGYFLGTTLLPALLVVGLGMAVEQLAPEVPEKYAAYTPYLPVLPLVAAVFAVIVVTVKRFQNLAMSGWWLLGLFVPLLNLWLNYRLFACPAGYAFTRKLDGIGVLLAILYWVLLLAGPVFFALVLTGVLGDAMTPEDLRERLQQLENLVPQVKAAK